MYVVHRHLWGVLLQKFKEGAELNFIHKLETAYRKVLLRVTTIY